MQLVTFERHNEAQGDRSLERERSGASALGFDSLEPVNLGTRRLGVLIQIDPEDDAVVDLNRALAVKLAGNDAGAPEAEADSLLPPDMQTFLRHLPASLEAAHTAHAFALEALSRYDGPDVRRAGAVVPRRSVRLCAPLPRPGKIIGVARNYALHASEQGQRKPPQEPVLFLKATSAVIGPEDEIQIPEATHDVDYEGELAAVIGATAREVPAAEALTHVAGYCIANDVSARDFQNVRGQRFIGKSCDTFAPLGPALVTRDEIQDPQDLAIRTTVSGEVLQSGRTKEMLFPVAEIVAFASRLMTLEPGDVLLTGTPAGVGQARKPPRWLRDGDVVEVEIEKLGRLRNYVRERR